MEHPPRHSVSVAAVILNEDQTKVLLIRRRDNGQWEPPGGVLEYHETLDEGVRREVREETGLAVRVVRLTGVYKNMSKSIVALVFRCTALEGRPAKQSPEASSIAWIPVLDVDALLAPAYAIRVRDALDGTTVFTRAHDGTHLLDEAQLAP